jgi:hypothetical protein
MKTPTVSVLMPTYNYGRFLGEAIESVLSQDFQDYEFIIVDDCSADNSREVAGRYAGRHAQLRFETNPANLGMVANWNRCLAASRGRYVKFVFGDDILAGPKTLGTLVSMLEADSAIVLAASGRVILDEASRRIDRWAPFGAPGRYSGKKAIMKCLARNANLIGEPSAVLFRRDTAARGFDGGLQHLVDLEMWFHLLEQGDFAYTSQPLCGFRIHSGQQSKSNERQQTGEKEYGRLVAQYDKPWLWMESSAGERYRIAQNLARARRRVPGEATSALEQRFRQSVSMPWRPIYSVAVESSGLWRRLRRSVGKRLWRLFYSVVPTA